MTVLPPIANDTTGPDRDAALPFEFERIRLCIAAIDAAGLVDDAGVKKQSFGKASLACIHMGEDAQIHSAHEPPPSQKFGCDFREK
ncbi:UNVERIFIED_ORG: hypothetical protein GGI61_001627 [Rhizobium esperanzae]